MSDSLAEDRKRWRADVARYNRARFLFWVALGLAICADVYSVYVLIRMISVVGLSVGETSRLYRLATDGIPMDATFSGIQMAIVTRVAALRLHVIYTLIPAAVLVLWRRRIRHETQLWSHIDKGQVMQERER